MILTNKNAATIPG
ncbi:hypothetical protein YPPY34_2384, partial [Yersinia pestis PY-34]